MEANTPPENTEAENTDPTAPSVPQVDHRPETPEEVQALASEFAQYRKEVAALRTELAAQRRPAAPAVAVTETLEDRATARREAIGKFSHYCPGCGKLVKYPQQCEGSAAAPHPPIEVVSTEELSEDADPAYHTAAPASEAGLYPVS